MKEEMKEGKESKKLRILAAGDFHSDESLAKRLAERAEKENVDLVILCGDLTGYNGKTDNMVGHFIGKNKKVLMVPGNHDSIAQIDFLADLYGAKNIHGYSVRYADVGIFGCSAANVGPEQLSEGEIFSLLQKGFDRISYLKKKIMVTHVHPSGTKMESFSRFVRGSEGVKKAIERFHPDIMLCSHVHEAHGIEEKMGKTRVVNVGREGKIIEL